MNKRIKELAEQAMWHTNSKTGEVYRTHFQFEERFAELIVKECINQIDGLKDIAADDMIAKGYRSWDSYSGTIDDAKHKLEEHFGVEL